MSEMGLHDPFGYLKHKLWPKEGPGVKLAIWLVTIKSQESRNPLACRWLATYHWKALNESHNFSLDLISIRGLHTKLWAPKVTKVPTLGILGLPFGSPGTKCHSDAGLVAKYRVYYKGEGDGFPQVRAMVNFVRLSLLVACPSTKNVQTMH
jgi:hypothetical protein